MSIETIPEIKVSTIMDPFQWDRYVLSHANGGVYLTAAWKDVVERAYGHRTFYLSAYAGSTMIGGLPLVLVRPPLTRGRLVSLPFCDYGGLLADNDESLRILLEQSLSLAMRLGTGLEIRSREPCNLLETDHRFLQRTKKCRMVLGLPCSADILWGGFKSKLRSQVKRASKGGLVFRLGQNELVPDFYEVFSRNMRDLGSPVHSGKWLREVMATFKERAKVGVVYKGVLPLAAGIALAHGRTLTVPWASALREFNRLSPNMLLYWSLLQYGANHGFELFDFGRSTPGEGTYAFKEQWGACPAPLYWYRLVSGQADEMRKKAHNGGLLRMVVEKVWRRFPLFVVNRVGPHLRKYIDK